MPHHSVLLREAVESLALREGMTVVDGTFGAGGHSRAIAEAIGRSGHLFAFDQDETVFAQAVCRDLDAMTQFIPVSDNFRRLKSVLASHGTTEIDGALFDLGLSSTQLEESGRGFSFRRDEPLGMTFNAKPVAGSATAEIIVNHWSEETLRTILTGFGEERYARAIAKAIVSARATGPIVTTSQLAEVIRLSTPARYHHARTHYATRTFQALRMAVNDELGAIEEGVRAAADMLHGGGRIAVISFHSVEDRAVKQLCRELALGGIVRLVKRKPVIPSDAEIQRNPRARSAKLRVVEKL